MAIPVLGVAHANVNCTSLARSLPFYRDVLGLTPLIHTAAAPQDGSGFGLTGNVSWDAWMMADAGGMASTAIDLLEWKTPAPVGSPDGVLGFSRLRIGVADVDRVRRIGGERDPDGVPLELVPAPATRLLGVGVGCRDLERSLAWYQRALALDVTNGARADTRMLRPRGQPDGFALELAQYPDATGRMLPANHVGIFRVAFLVADARAAHAGLERLGVDCPPPAFLDLGPEVPIDGVWAVFFRDPDGACLELIEIPS